MPDYNLGTVVGSDGKGISSIAKTSTSGAVDTYTITYTDGTTSTFTVTNAETVDSVTDGDMNAVTSNAVYDFVQTTLGNIQEYVNR